MKTRKARKLLGTIGILILVVGGIAALAWSEAPAHAARPETAGTWVIEVIQESSQLRNMGRRSLALDPNLSGGTGVALHLAFGGDHLYHAYHDGTQWSIDLVDPADQVGGYTSLAIDGNGYPHVSYYDEANADLKYARYDGLAWRIERVDSDGYLGQCTTLALGPDGRPQISYYDMSNRALKLAWQEPEDNTWHTATLRGDLGSGGCAGLALDDSGRSHLSYTDNGLYYTYVDADDAWQLELVDGDAYVNGPSALALDGQGKPHMAYCQRSTWGYCTTLRHAYHDGTQWHVEAVDVGGWQGEECSLALDAAGRPHLTFRDSRSGMLRYARYDGSLWQIEEVDSGGYYSSLVLDPAGRPHVSYYDSITGLLKYAHVVPPTFADPAFEGVWQRTDRPIAEGRVARSWTWGPRPFTAALFEPYADSPGGSRLVQYFDKSRMEINDPNADPTSAWFVTNGLLVREMVDGWLQLGDNEFERRAPAEEAVAGDPAAVNPTCPRYASFTQLTWERAPDRTGQPVSATLARDGTVGDDPTKAAYPGTAIAHYEEATGHNVPAVLWEFMHQRGLIYLDGRYRTGLVVDWLFAMGYPISEPYWVRCAVAGEEKDVLVQLFERRVLTYTPSNPPGWQVEMGNVGRHYYTWRYGVEPEP